MRLIGRLAFKDGQEITAILPLTYYPNIDVEEDGNRPRPRAAWNGAVPMPTLRPSPAPAARRCRTPLPHAAAARAAAAAHRRRSCPSTAAGADSGRAPPPPHAAAARRRCPPRRPHRAQW
jgi:hypothetical protein